MPLEKKASYLVTPSSSSVVTEPRQPATPTNSLAISSVSSPVSPFTSLSVSCTLGPITQLIDPLLFPSLTDPIVIDTVSIKSLPGLLPFLPWLSLPPLPNLAKLELIPIEFSSSLPAPDIYQEICPQNIFSSSPLSSLEAKQATCPVSLHKIMEESCETFVPYTLLGFLIRRITDPDPFSSCYSGDLLTSYFLRDYFTRGTNAILWILLFSITFILLSRLTQIVRLWALGGRIPGPPVWPLFGGCATVAPLCGSDRGLLSKLHDNYGPLVRLWFGPSQLFVSVKDTQLIKEILVKAKDKLPLSGRAYNLAFGALNFFVSAFNDKVNENRESLADYLNNKFISTNVIKNLVERTNSLDCTTFARCMAFKAIGTTLFGDIFLNWKNMAQYEELLMTVAKDGFFWASYVIVPFWRRDYWRYRLVCERMKGLTLEIMELSERNSNTVLKASCGDLLGLMLHGCVTTASLIENILTRLVLYPNLQEQIYSEVSTIHKGSHVISTDEVKKMQFLLGTVLESARIMPARPFLQRCSLKSDMRLENGIVIPAGAIICVPLHLVQMNGSIWGEDFLKFVPSRFLSNENNLDEKESTRTKSQYLNESTKFEALLSFGDGARACVGQSFAVLSSATLVASIVCNFEIKLHPNAAKDSGLAAHDTDSQENQSPQIVLSERTDAN